MEPVMKRGPAMCQGNGCLTSHCFRRGTACWSTWAYRAFGLAAEQSGSRLDTRRWSLSLRLWWGTDENSHRCWNHRGCSLEREESKRTRSYKLVVLHSYTRFQMWVVILGRYYQFLPRPNDLDKRSLDTKGMQTACALSFSVTASRQGLT